MKWNKAIMYFSLFTVISLSGCGNAKESENTLNDHSTGHSEENHGTQSNEHSTSHSEEEHGTQSNEHSHNGHETSDQQSNKPVSLSEVKGVVASTSLTAMIAKAAGAKNVTYIAPLELRHPPEYDYRPSDLSKITDSYIIYLGYEPFMKKLIESSNISSDLTAVIEVDNTPDGYLNEARKLANIWGTQAEEAKWEEEFNKVVEELEQLAKKQDVSKVKVISQVYMTPLVKWFGFDVVGEYGPEELTAAQLKDLIALKPDLIVDNAHMPQGKGLATASDKTKLVELRSYPDGTLNSVQDILIYNAKQLEIVK
ncbi:hypothetical protein JTI58_21585 [Lysinibacillus fusiformis]|uniref:hypothetical protein n=2 Tax=Lysinibacillus TaxID=400634 RepID=UPI0019674498|nr:hypothetical protein [Lysinibacillus fusiformis]QSB09547.1 hypothetical protein JTI58_21585 [Lysinibacillus fusiformis]